VLFEALFTEQFDYATTDLARIYPDSHTVRGSVPWATAVCC